VTTLTRVLEHGLDRGEVPALVGDPLVEAFSVQLEVAVVD
jgi:hypothetical protein